MRLELQALPKAVAGNADQNKPADDHQTLQHGYWTSQAAVRFNHDGAEPISPRARSGKCHFSARRGKSSVRMMAALQPGPLQHSQRRLSLCNLMVEPSRVPVAKALLTPHGRAFACHHLR
jgi:hypothetical protein